MNIENSLPCSTGLPSGPPSGLPHDRSQGFVPLPERLFLLLEDPIHFARYLGRLHPEARAGVPNDGFRCPLARFLTSMSGSGPSLEVGAERVFFGGGGSSGILAVAPLPYWAQLFVELVDEPAGPGDSGEMPMVSEITEVLDDALLLDLLRTRPLHGRNCPPLPARYPLNWDNEPA